MRTPLARLERLEAAAHPGTCPTCNSHRTRIVSIDEHTGEEPGASLPADGCPTCGRPIRRERRIVGVTMDEMA
jgi:endogenous inhibitor of DNA gyrase (YacG/DUF329 family)